LTAGRTETYGWVPPSRDRDDDSGDGSSSPASAGPSFTLSYGVDAWCWWLDDTFSSSLIDVETSRSTPVFHDIRIDVRRLFGVKFSFHVFTDKPFQPFGIFDQKFSGSSERTSGGYQTTISVPFSRIAALFTSTDFGSNDLSENLSLECQYLYRMFRWETDIKEKFLENSVDYYDENGKRHLFPVGTTFTTGSRLNDLQLGVSFSGNMELPLYAFVGMQVFELKAPTLLGLYEDTDNYMLGTDFIMHSSSVFTGLQMRGSGGFNPADVMSAPYGLGVAGTVGMSLGSVTVKNDYLDGPGSLGFNMSLGAYGSLRVAPRERLRSSSWRERREPSPS